MKTKIKFLTCLVFVLVMMTALGVYGDALAASKVTLTSLIMNVGADETERNLAWYATREADAYVMYGKADEPLDKTAPAVCSKTITLGLYSYKATLTGIEPGAWTYRIIVDDNVFPDHTFEVYDTSESVSFAFITDAQTSSSDNAASWTDTLQKIKANFDNISFIVSAGDQTSDPMSEWEFIHFASPELANLAISTTVGILHDNSVLYAKHYNLPNLSSEYGVSKTSSNYFYKYSNILFMHLNVENMVYSEHIKFVQKTIEENPDCAWRVVVIHYSFLSAGAHSKEWDVEAFRKRTAGALNESGVDIVLSGHDHTYARSKMMLDGTTISSDIVVDNTVTDPEGTLYLCGTGASNCKFYDVYYEDDAKYIACRNDDNRKGAVIFNATDTSLSFKSYFFDKDTPELMDSFTINKTPEIADTSSDT